MFRSKNYKEASKIIDKSVTYDPQEAFKLVCDALMILYTYVPSSVFTPSEFDRYALDELITGYA